MDGAGSGRRKVVLGGYTECAGPRNRDWFPCASVVPSGHRGGELIRPLLAPLHGGDTEF